VGDDIRTTAEVVEADTGFFALAGNPADFVPEV
jgi:hypothetical protein